MEKKTQTSEILKYMKKHRKSGITSMEAFQNFGATRLSGTMYSLKKQGYQIITEPRIVKTRYGRSTQVSAYKLVSDEIHSQA